MTSDRIITDRARHAIPVDCEPFLPIMETAKSTEMIVSEGPHTTFGKGSSKERIVTVVVLAVALIFLIVGIVLIAIAANDQKNEKSSGSTSKEKEKKTTESILCEFSEEAKRVEFGAFLDRVKATYFKLHPYNVYQDLEVTTERVKADFVGYDPTPSVIKKRTDTALDLLSEVNGKNINSDKLKPRARRALAQVKHYLQHVFGWPYDVNYYAGDWMMGPNLFCWQEICYQGYAVYNGLGLYHKPYNASDVELTESKLNTHKAGILQYIENMKMGVRKGMIRSVEECEAGINTIKRQYLKISLYNSTGKLRNCCFVACENSLRDGCLRRLLFCIM